jgi:hypothetical protein
MFERDEKGNFVYLNFTAPTHVKFNPLKRANRSDYGKKLATGWQVFHGNRWRKVWCVCYSNSGSTYVMVKKKRFLVNIYN